MRTISHYEILEKLGEGGMGIVWKARDTRLDRFVAIKFLPPENTADPERRRRFAQEAKAASALNHPRIITIYDIGHDDGADFIAMEFVSGKTLEQLIPAKGMPVGDAVRYAMQIADALAAAHSAGIVHRDLKPANVMVTDSGQVKVLDFGLAKLEAPTGLKESENTQTVVKQTKTQEGAIVGTVSYMSPEQAEGKKLDARSDIFSFGSVLYEMLTGRRAFRGDSNMSTLAGILRADPEPLDKLVDGVPRELTRLVQRCLRKNPDDRAQSMADLRIALKEIKEESEAGTQAATSLALPRSRVKWWWIAAALGVIAVAGFAGYLLVHANRAPESPLQATLLTSYPGLESTPSFSPDGNQVAFVWGGAQHDNFDIYVTLIGAGKPLRLTTDPAADSSPAWSPDGRSIAFIRGNSILLISPLGGAEREIAQGLFAIPARIRAFRRYQIRWSPDGRWLLVNTEDTDKRVSLFLISLETGEKRRLTSAEKRGSGDYDGAISPDGRILAFTRMAVIGSEVMTDSDIYTLSLGSDYSPKGEPRRLTFDKVLTEGLTWTSDSRDIVYSSLQGGSPALWRVPVSGAQKPIKLAVGNNGITPEISRLGNRLVFEQVIPSDNDIFRVSMADVAQSASSIIASTRLEQSPQYSPDGTKIAFSSERSGPSAIWVCDADGGNATPLTTTGNSGSPSWSHDGQRIAFDSIVNSQWQVFTISTRGGKPKQLTTGPASYSRPSWSHDGQWIYAAGAGGIVKIAAAGGTVVQLAPSGNNPVESDDGKTIYYQKLGWIWKIGTDGSSDHQAFDGPAGSGFSVTHDGIYYIPTDPNRTLQFFSFATGHSQLIRKLDHGATGLGISVSPDRHWLLYAQLTREATGDLMLVDPFR